MQKTRLFSLCLTIAVSSSLIGDPIKIMPVGDSITGGNHYQAPPLEEREGYRKTLYEMLINTGYDVDFVGSQDEGIRPEDAPYWYDWHSESYPGKQIDYITDKLKTTLPLYMPDILLVHVGTNGHDWEPKPSQVSDMLDMFNQFSIDHYHPMTVFLCKIINLCEGPEHLIFGEDTLTTQFNERVAEMAAARTGDQIKIIMVDMEKGAGLDYTDDPPDSTLNPPYEGGDMWGSSYPLEDGTDFDKYHPNDKGNAKIAVKFYEELVKELGDPAIILAEYPFDVDASDVTGTYHGVLEGDAVIVHNTIRGNVLSLNDSGFVSLPPELAAEMEDFSFSAWVRFAGTNPWAGLIGIGKATGSTYPYWDFHLKSDRTIRYYASADRTWPPDGCAQKVMNYTLPMAWTHIAFTFKKDYGAVIYINGVAQEQEAWDGDNDFSVTPRTLGADVFNVGKDSFNQTTLTHTLIDELKFYHTALSEVTVTTIYNAEKMNTVPDKIAHWRLDGDATDVYGQSDGTLHNIDVTMFVRGLVNKAIDFSAGSDSSYIEVADNVYIDFDSTASFTASCLVKASDYSQTMDVLFKGATQNDGGEKKGLWYGLFFKNGELRWAVDDDVNKSQLAFPDAATKMKTRRGWSHLVAIRDRGQDSLRLFINGEQVASMKDVTESEIISTPLPLIIGNNQDRNNNFKGLIDDVQLYNYALDASDIQRLFESYQIRVLVDTNAEDDLVIRPFTYSLKQNYPNPFNPETQIEFELEKGGQTTLTVYNAMGQWVSTVLDKNLEIGNHCVSIRFDQQASGLYFYHIQSGSFLQTQKMLLMK